MHTTKCRFDVSVTTFYDHSYCYTRVTRLNNTFNRLEDFWILKRSFNQLDINYIVISVVWEISELHKWTFNRFIVNWMVFSIVCDILTVVKWTFNRLNNRLRVTFAYLTDFWIPQLNLQSLSYQLVGVFNRMGNLFNSKWTFNRLIK